MTVNPTPTPTSDEKEKGRKLSPQAFEQSLWVPRGEGSGHTCGSGCPKGSDCWGWEPRLRQTKVGRRSRSKAGCCLSSSWRSRSLWTLHATLPERNLTVCLLCDSPKLKTSKPNNKKKPRSLSDFTSKWSRSCTAKIRCTRVHYRKSGRRRRRRKKK